MARSIKQGINRRIADLKAIRGIERRAHFEAGGTVEGWRGRHTVTVDRRHESSRMACRDKEREDE